MFRLKRLLIPLLVLILLLVPALPVLAAYPDETWISPTDATGIGWNALVNIYDENVASYAITTTGVDTVWYPPITTTVPAMSCQKVRIHAKFFAPSEMDLDVFWEGEWHDVYLGGAPTSDVWNEYDLGGTYTVTQARFSFRRAFGGTCYVIRVNEFDFQEAYPLIQTQEATNLLDGDATLQGTITDLGNGTVYAYFQWGTSTAYGTDTDEQEITETGNYHQDLSGFTAGVVYHYRAAVRYDTDKYWYGDDKTVSLAAAWANAYSASDITATTATLNGYVTSLGDYSVAYFRFQYGIGDYASETEEQTFTSAGPIEADIDTLASGEDYQFRIYIRCATTQYTGGSPQTFQTISAAPSNASATATEGYNELTLAWTKGTGAAETVIRASAVDYPATYTSDRLVYQGDGTSFVDIKLAGGVTYYYSFWSITGGTPSDEHCTALGAADILPGRTEYYNEGDTTAVQVYGANWATQTFTATWQHNLELVSLLLYREGDPGTVSVSLTLTDAAGYSVGDYVATGTINGNLITTDTYGLWYSFDFGVGVELEPDEQYAIIIRATTGDAANYIGVRYDATGEYDGGIRLASSDSAFSWVKYPDTDILFETYSKYLFKILDARVFSSFIVEGDWLIVFTYQNLFHPTGIPDEYFDNRLLDGEVVLAKTKMAAWGYRPGSIYICADEAAPLAWRSGYTIRMRARFTDDLGNRPTTDYTLQSIDWAGDDLTLLDKWILSRANNIGDFYTYEVPVGVDADGDVVYDSVKTVLTGFTSGGWFGLGAKERLNEQGAAMFLVGIPHLNHQRPDLFLEEAMGGRLDTGEETYTHAGDTLDWETILGSDTVNMFGSWGVVWGMEGKEMAQIVMFGLFLLIAALLTAGVGSMGLAVAGPMSIAGALTGLFPVAALIVGTAMVVFVVVWMVWFRRAT